MVRKQTEKTAHFKEKIFPNAHILTPRRIMKNETSLSRKRVKEHGQL